MTLNLHQHRTGESIWDRERQAEWDTERWLAAAMASACVLIGLRRGALPGWLLTIGGGGLAWWAATGAETRQIRRGHLQQVWPRNRAEDSVAEASEESFPASDAPSWTPTTGNR